MNVHSWVSVIFRGFQLCIFLSCIFSLLFLRTNSFQWSFIPKDMLFWRQNTNQKYFWKVFRSGKSVFNISFTYPVLWSVSFDFNLHPPISTVFPLWKDPAGQQRFRLSFELLKKRLLDFFPHFSFLRRSAPTPTTPKSLLTKETPSIQLKIAEEIRDAVFITGLSD